MEVVNNLSHDPGPVNGVHCCQFGFTTQKRLVAKALFNHALAVIKIAFNGNIVDVVTLHRGHLATLYFRYTLVRVQDEDIHVLTAATALNSRRPGIPGSRAHNYCVLLTLFKHMIQQAAEQLKGKTLECQCWPAESLHHPFVSITLHQRSNRRMRNDTEGVIK